MATRELDPEYFSTATWKDRVDSWLQRESSDPFLEGNRKVVRQIMEHAESGLRMVVNISADALLSFLSERRYRNLYERPLIGGERNEPSPERMHVDTALGFGADAPHYYFGAVALGGTGVRFYGEFCMVLRPGVVSKDTQIFDRDSYDLLLPPLSDHTFDVPVSQMLKGLWGTDTIDMLTLKVLPELRAARHLVTTGRVSELILRDQEFVEIHRKGSIAPADLEEVRQSPDDIAIEARILSRTAAGHPPTAVELRWLDQRASVAAALDAEGVRYRVVTLHGRGYQWR